ncbi:site-specific integrase [Clostridium sediminicola]|uniref:site-specific integrase n=1 Tax=Clostridium sediminicola TaxID=3114879 RepID=UPI003D16A3B4
MSQDDYKKILGRFPKGHGYYIPLQIAFHTGISSAEVCGLTWDCVDLRNGIIYVEKTLIYKDKKWTFSSPKTKSSYREIYLGDTLVRVLKEHKQMQRINKVKYGSDYITSEFVCTKENGQFITKNDLNRLSRIVNKKLNIDFTFHALRHTHATMLLEADVPMKEIQERLGHSESSTTMDIYSHVTTNMKEDSVLKLEMINSKL